MFDSVRALARVGLSLLTFYLGACGDDSAAVDAGADAGQVDAGNDVTIDVPVDADDPCGLSLLLADTESVDPLGGVQRITLGVSPAPEALVFSFLDAPDTIIVDQRASSTGFEVDYVARRPLSAFIEDSRVSESTTVRAEFGDGCVQDFVIDLNVIPDIQWVSEAADGMSNGDIEAVDVANNGTVVFSSDAALLPEADEEDAPCDGPCFDAFTRVVDEALVLVSDRLGAVNVRSPSIRADGQSVGFAALGNAHFVRGVDGSDGEQYASACAGDCDSARYWHSDLAGERYAFGDYASGEALLRLAMGAGEPMALVSRAGDDVSFQSVRLQPNGDVTFRLVRTMVGEQGLFIWRSVDEGEVMVHADSQHMALSADGGTFLIDYVSDEGTRIELRDAADIADGPTLTGTPVWSRDDLVLLGADDDLEWVVALREVRGAPTVEFLRRDADGASYSPVMLQFRGPPRLPSRELWAASVSPNGEWAVFVTGDTILGQTGETRRAYRVRLSR